MKEKDLQWSLLLHDQTDRGMGNREQENQAQRWRNCQNLLKPMNEEMRNHQPKGELREATIIQLTDHRYSGDDPTPDTLEDDISKIRRNIKEKAKGKETRC
ncbi:hypothetical protein JTB14_010644 [Gonioctena quinquepunctata]|nr:hypothetical protein JTB14_010644 [Gonioctena quinquepunctata]